jgi:hypothetical protein
MASLNQKGHTLDIIEEDLGFFYKVLMLPVCFLE